MSYGFLSIAIGATLGAWMRWGLGNLMNSFFPTIPLGTLAANLIGGFLIGIFMAFLQIYPSIPQEIRLGITTGFLGGLTTFSTFSAEATTLWLHQEHFWLILLIGVHVIGSIGMTLFGMFLIKLFLK